MADPVLKHLGWQARIGAALVDALKDGAELAEMWDHRRVKTAIIVETRKPGEWRLSQSEQLMRTRGWDSARQIYESAGIKSNHWPAIDLYTQGYELREIANHVGQPFKIVWQWLDRDLPKLRRLDLGELN